MSSFGSTLNNRYRLDKLIGEGGFAKVFLATDLELGRQVAVKVLEPDWARDKELLTRFRVEARAIASLDHPNILQIYDFGVAKGAPYLVLPYISGSTLAARMKQGPFSLLSPVIRHLAALDSLGDCPGDDLAMDPALHHEDSLDQQTLWIHGHLPHDYDPASRPRWGTCRTDAPVHLHLRFGPWLLRL